MQQKSVEIEYKIVQIHERWEKLKFRQNDEPSKFLKTLKILKNQITELTKSKDDIIQTIKNDMTRINASYHRIVENQVLLPLYIICNLILIFLLLSLGLRFALPHATGQHLFE